MIYIVKCYSCEQEFRVKRGETGADMICPECGKANSIRDVVERIEDEPGKVDPNMQAIKGFDMDEHPVAFVDGYDIERRKEKNRWKWIGIVLAIVVILIEEYFSK